MQVEKVAVTKNNVALHVRVHKISKSSNKSAKQNSHVKVSAAQKTSPENNDLTNANDERTIRPYCLDAKKHYSPKLV